MPTVRGKKQSAASAVTSRKSDEHVSKGSRSDKMGGRSADSATAGGASGASKKKGVSPSKAQKSKLSAAFVELPSDSDIDESLSRAVPAVLSTSAAATVSASLGMNVSGRWWKPPPKASDRPSTLSNGTKGIHPSYAKRMEEKEAKLELASLNKQVGEEVDALRKRVSQARAARRLYREQNQESARVVQQISNIKKIKRLPKKKLIQGRIQRAF